MWASPTRHGGFAAMMVALRPSLLLLIIIVIIIITHCNHFLPWPAEQFKCGQPKNMCSQQTFVHNFFFYAASLSLYPILKV
jgi:hypothetical protein